MIEAATQTLMLWFIVVKNFSTHFNFYFPLLKNMVKILLQKTNKNKQMSLSPFFWSTKSKSCQRESHLDITLCSPPPKIFLQGRENLLWLRTVISPPIPCLYHSTKKKHWCFIHEVEEFQPLLEASQSALYTLQHQSKSHLVFPQPIL